MAKKSSKTPLIAGGIAGGCLLLCLCGGVITLLVMSGGDGTSKSSGETATAISALNMLMEGGSSDWDMAVKPLMLDGFDSNNSGSIDTAGEVSSVDCGTWTALDSGVKEKWDYGLRTIYGFHADYSWVGDAVGFSETIRPQADTALAGCLGEDPSFAGAAAAPAAAPATGGGDVATRIKAFPDGGSSEWDEKVKGVMLGAYDTDGSGEINTAAEVGGVPCDVWKAMDEGVKAKYGFGMRSIYGFEAGYTWIGYAVGFAEGQRTVADAALVGCVGS